LILQSAGVHAASIPALVASAGWFSKAILLILVVMSVYSWAVIWNRVRLYSRVERADREFEAGFRRLPANAEFRLICEQHPHSLLARVALAGHRYLEQHPAAAGERRMDRWEGAQRAMDRSSNEESGLLERHVGYLATVGNVSPFIGLLGTVWGVMSAFLNIGNQGSASLVVVAPGIAEALIATVAGLAAAIPAVVGYNHLLGRLRELANHTGRFTSEFLDVRLGGAPR
jgi:biopolymer transport protein TolQ